MPARGGKADGSAGAHSPAWVAALHDAFPDVEWLDSELDLGEGRRIDWAGVENSGRAVLAARCDGQGDAAVTLALDVAVFFHRHRTVLGQHLRSPRLRASLPPVIALVAESFSERTLGRLAGIGTAGLRLYEFRQLASSRGERAYLIPVAPGFGGRPGASELRGPQTFLAGLSERVRPLGELLVRRIGRIDDQLVAAAGETSLSWRLGDEPICSVSLIEDALEVQVAPDRGVRVLSTEAEVESFVDEALGRYVSLIGGGPMTPLSEAPVLAADDLGLTLTAEEIAAFRQPG